LPQSNKNLLRNSAFATGGDAPRLWTWCGNGAVKWRFAAAPDRDGSRVVVLDAGDGASAGGFRQTVHVRGATYYRIEATLRAACTRTDPTGGAALDLTARDGDDNILDDAPGCGCAAERRSWTVWRRYYRTPKGTKKLDVTIGLRGATGRAEVESVRVVPIEDLETTGHARAMPPPPWGYPPPRRARSVLIGDDSPAAQRLAEIIALRLGHEAIQCRPADTFKNDLDRATADVIVMPSADALPKKLSLKGLDTLAEDRIVVIGLDAFCDLVNRKQDEPILKTRRLVETAEPPHAAVHFANFLTRGFALLDAFPYWSDPKQTGVYRQRVLRKTSACTKFCKAKGYEIILHNEGSTDASSRHPLCLFHATTGGGVVVIDLEPMVAHPTGEDESSLAVHILFNILGLPQNSLGQFIAPGPEPADIARELDEFASRFPAFQVRKLDGEDASSAARRVEVGAPGEQLGVPLIPPPTVLIRTGADSWDWDGVYGAFFWLKSLFLPPPFVNGTARPLLARRRIAWSPLIRPERWGRFDRDTGTPDTMVAKFDRGSVAAVIDVVATPTPRTRLVTPSDQPPYDRYACALPALTAAMLDRRHVFYAAGNALAPAELNGAGFLLEPRGCDVVAEPAAFATEFHRGAIDAGAACLRLELPGEPHAGCAHSIRRTDRAALMLEWLVGLQLGLIVLNRDAEPITLEIPLVLPDGGDLHIINDAGDVSEQRALDRNGADPLSVSLDPGSAVVLVRRNA